MKDINRKNAIKICTIGALRRAAFIELLVSAFSFPAGIASGNNIFWHRPEAKEWIEVRFYPNYRLPKFFSIKRPRP